MPSYNPRFVYNTSVYKQSKATSFLSNFDSECIFIPSNIYSTVVNVRSIFEEDKSVGSGWHCECL